jgi:putative ABC transport system permease protein
MIVHYLVLSFRSFKKHLGSFLINLFGLVTGLAFSTFIFLWVTNELNVDSFLAHRDELFQVFINEPAENDIATTPYTPGVLGSYLQNAIPEVENSVEVIEPVSFYNGTLSQSDTHIKVDAQYAGKEFFNLFTYDLIVGDKRSALTGTKGVVLTEETAKKLFNSTDCLGKMVEFKNETFTGLFEVTGVTARTPYASSMNFDVLFSYDLFLEERPDVHDWNNGGPSTFLLLKKGTDPEAFNEKIKNLIIDKPGRAGNRLYAQRFASKYLYGTFKNGVAVTGRIVNVRLFSVIAIVIVIIACINYMNLATAQGARRMKEIGVKKAVGAQRSSIFSQYMTESMLMVTLALVLALGVVWALVPYFNELSGKSISFNLSVNLLLILVCVTAVTGFVAGFYPSLYLSAFNPLKVLKGQTTNSLGELLLRKGLVTFQFVASVFLIVSVLVVHSQINFITTKDLGFKDDNVLSFQIEGTVKEKLAAYLEDVKRIPGVVNASFAGDLSSRKNGLSWPGKPVDGSEPRFYYMDASYDLVNVLGISLKEGRNFSRNYPSDSLAIIFNEAAITEMGLKDPIGQEVEFYGKRKIIGIVKNFHFEPFYEKVKPLFFKFDGDPEGNVLIKIQKGQEQTTVASVEEHYRKFNPGYPFAFTFLDEEIQKNYEAETRLALLSKYFAGIAIIISCLGLLGLTAFAAQKRTKEIGIRKALGATNMGSIILVSREFMQLVLIALAIGLPLSYVALNEWLHQFEYHINISTWHLLVAALVTSVVSFTTVCLQSIRATSVDITRSLRADN